MSILKSKVETNPKISLKGSPKSSRIKKAVKGLKLSKKKASKGALDKRSRRLLKLQSKKHSSVVIKILPLWEILRREETPKRRRFEIINEILKESKTILVDLCLAHDTARVVECCVQHGTEVQRWNVFAEIKNSLKLLAKSRYARFVLIKLIKYGAKEHRLAFFKHFRGHVARLVNHKLAAEVVDLLYNDYANSTQRGQLMQELYGHVHALKLAENEAYSLERALALNPDKQHSILYNVNTLLISMASKGLTKYTIVQHLLLEFLRAVTPLNVQLPVPGSTNSHDLMDTDDLDDMAEKLTGGSLLILLETLVDGQVVPMLHTREGVRAALQLLFLCSPALRRQLVRGLKTCISSIARNEHGHLFIIGILDFVDDIVLLKKSVVKEILEDLHLFCTHPECRKVLLYALSPRDPRHFSPQFQQGVFHAGDSNPYTTKPLGVRAMELRSPHLKLLPKLLQFAKDHLLDVFVGDASREGRLALEDRGRVVLLAEILIRSAVHHLNMDEVSKAYSRSMSGSDQEDISKLSSLAAISPTDMALYQQLRKDVFVLLTKSLLVPPFVPAPNAVSGVTKSRDRNEERSERHRRAVFLAEQTSTTTLKPGFPSFTNEADHRLDESVTTPDIASIMSFIERPEGHLFMNRLLSDGKQHADYTFGQIIMKHVTPSNLCQWTRCNRGCFILVNLFEFEDKTISQLLHSALSPCFTELSCSPLPGAKALCKRLGLTV